MGSGNKIDRASGRKMRESAAIWKKAEKRAASGRNGGIKRSNGKAAEKRITWRQREAAKGKKGGR